MNNQDSHCRRGTDGEHVTATQSLTREQPTNVAANGSPAQYGP